MYTTHILTKNLNLSNINYKSEITILVKTNISAETYRNVIYFKRWKEYINLKRINKFV